MNAILNGFGRIGRNIFYHILYKHSDINVIHINDVNITIDNAIYLLKYDSTYGPLIKESIYKEDNNIVIEIKNQKKRIHFTQLANPFNCNSKYDILLDATGSETNNKLQEYLQYCNKIFLTRWYEDADRIILCGEKDIVNDPKEQIISLGICDTVGITPILSKLNFDEIDSISIVTLHPYLGYQNVLDGPPRDVTHSNEPFYQIGRSTLNSVIPKSSSVQNILCHIYPKLRDKLCFMTYRVPTDVVTTCDITVTCTSNTQANILKDKLYESLKRDPFIDVIEENVPLVSRDFLYSEKCCSIEPHWIKTSTKYLHLTAWYNNEYGYSSVISNMISNYLKCN